MEYYGYKGFIGKIKYYMRFLAHWILQSLAKISPHPGIAVMLQRLRGVSIGNHVYLGPGVNLDDLYPQLIKIENYVSIGMNTMIFTHSNPTCSYEIKTRYYPRVVKETVIKKGAWIAPGCIILSGVVIGENSVIGAGSVIVKNVEPYTVTAGNPAKVVKKLN
ncbi:acyltransferase [Desulfotomaculum copahuensis]|uniref:acyltransferase n=1 Tax=Desulfotomaculum copahuensis TaxID=1838280 RepID=UPI00099017C8|nr:acyltransferase [Desulfotomaculum copahuensis]